MNPIWLSVILPTHHGERWLGGALRSVLQERDAGIECIVVDSSATGATVQLATGFANLLPLQAFERRDLPAWTSKTNFGASVARGDYLCILHQDDCWLPGRAAAVRRWVSDDRRKKSVFLNPSVIIDEDGRPLGTWKCPLTAGRFLPGDQVRASLIVQNYVSIPAPVFRRDAFDQVGRLDTALWYTADWDLYLKLAAVRDFYYCPTPLTCFRIHSASLTVSGSGDSEDFAHQMRTVFDRHVGSLDREGQAYIVPIALASIKANMALAAALRGDYHLSLSALWSILRLGPAGMYDYLRYSRLVERLVPRLRARVTGAFRV